MATVHEWIRDSGAPVRYRVGSLRALAETVRGGEEFRFAIREFLDDLNLAAAVAPDQIQGMIDARPPSLEDPNEHAFIGALAEHVAMVHRLRRPAWAGEDDRFLSRWWFVAPSPAYDAVALRESPPAFRRRGIFLPASMLERV